MLSAREAAFITLSHIEKDGSYSNLAMGEVISTESLEPREAQLARRIVKTVLERKITLDYNLSLYLTQPVKKLKPQVLTVLRMGACQLLFMDKIPQSAAVNESVKLVKKHGCAFAAGLVNAVLRKAAAGGLVLPQAGDKTEYLSVKYSFPPYVVAEFCRHYGEDCAEKIMAASLGEEKLYIRKNTLKPQPLTVEAEVCEQPEDCYILTDKRDFTKSWDFRQGLFHVQDLSSQLCCAMLDPKKGETVIDVCAAPGGKSLTMAQRMENSGKIIACDIYDHKLKLINQSAKRLGVTIIQTALRDGAKDDFPLPTADRILCDVPCSGLGVTGKKPDIKYKSEADIAALPELQYKILCAAAPHLKPGGRLVYSTCTLLPQENSDVCRRFLSEHSDFVPVPLNTEVKGLRQGEFLTVLPHEADCDGFFIAAFERKV